MKQKKRRRNRNPAAQVTAPLQVAQRKPDEPPARDGRTQSQTKRERDWGDYPNRTLALVGLAALAMSAIQTCNTNDQLELTRESLELSQRAWLVVEQVRLPEKLELVANRVLAAPIVWKNTGQGPARRVTIYSGAFTMPMDRPFPIPPPEQPHADRSVVGIVGPGGSIIAHPEIPALSEEYLTQVKAGTRRLNIYGKARYTDVFNCLRWTTFCGEYDPTREHFRLCDVYNESDADQGQPECGPAASAK